MFSFQTADATGELEASGAIWRPTRGQSLCRSNGSSTHYLVQVFWNGLPPPLPPPTTKMLGPVGGESILLPSLILLPPKSSPGPRTSWR